MSDDDPDPLITRPSLLARVRDPRDAGAWEQFVQVYSPVINGYLRRRGLQDADAADVAQETLQAVARAIGGLEYDRGKGRFRGWLLTITRRNLLDHLAKARRTVAGSGSDEVQQVLESQPDPAESLAWDRECEQQLAWFAMQQVQNEFEPRTWRAFYATAIKDRPAQDVANELQMSAGAVYIAKSRVMARLRRAIEEIEEAE